MKETTTFSINYVQNNFQLIIVRTTDRERDRIFNQTILIFIKAEFVIEPDAGKYFFVNQGKLTIDGVDDAEEMRLTDEAFDTLGFSKVNAIFNKKKI